MRRGIGFVRTWAVVCLGALVAPGAFGGDPAKVTVFSPEGSVKNGRQARTEERSRFTAKITYPVEGLMVARDPDIPPGHQRVYFESTAHDPSVKWELNGRELAPALRDYAWEPGSPGTYELKLATNSGKVLDQIHFLVRN